MRVVLVVEDNDEIRALLVTALRASGLEPVGVGTARGALAEVRDRGVGLALVDLGLPDMPGVQLLSELRRLAPDLHLIVVSGEQSEASRIRAFAAGADDFVVKPFSVPELVARAHAGIRRRREAAQGLVTHGELTVDVAQRTVAVAGRPIQLSRREFDLLAYLALHPGRVFTRADLLEEVWGSSELYQSSATVTEHLRRLRNHLVAAGGDPGWVETVRGVGYRFVARPVQSAAPKPLVQAVLEQSGLVELSVESDGTIRAASEGACDFFGAEGPSALVGRPIFRLVAPEALPSLQARADRARAGEWPAPEVLVWQRFDGIRVLAEIASTPGWIDDVDVAMVTLWPPGIRQSELLQTVIAGVTSEVSDAVIVTTDDTTIRSFNPAAERLYGWSAEEVQGRRFRDLIEWVGDEAELDAARARLAATGSWAGRARQRRRDGSVVEVEGSVTALTDRAGKRYGIIAVNREARPHVRVASGSSRAELEAALAAGEIVPHYQPIARLHDGRLYGFEALARWCGSDGSVRPAAEFIAQAEADGLVHALGDAIFQQVLVDVRSWQATGFDSHVCVNLSGRQLSSPTLADRMVAQMADAGIAPGSLWFEVTETSLIEDLDAVAHALQTLVAAGSRVLIDDFGTGWASLTYLRRFPIHGLKVDKTFVHGLGSGGHDEAIVRSVLRLGRELSIAVVAEGVETMEQAEALRALGCVIGQGFLFGRPVPADQVELRIAGEESTNSRTDAEARSSPGS